MLKTIKTTKKLRLDELINYIFEEDIKPSKNLIKYRSKFGTVVEVDMSGQIAIYGRHFGNELYTVEIEEEITEDTEFLGVQEVYLDKLEQKIRIENYFGKTTVEEVLSNHEEYTECLQVHAKLNGKLELIWERE